MWSSRPVFSGEYSIPYFLSSSSARIFLACRDALDYPLDDRVYSSFIDYSVVFCIIFLELLRAVNACVLIRSSIMASIYLTYYSVNLFFLFFLAIDFSLLSFYFLGSSSSSKSSKSSKLRSRLAYILAISFLSLALRST